MIDRSFDHSTLRVDGLTFTKVNPTELDRSIKKPHADVGMDVDVLTSSSDLKVGLQAEDRYFLINRMRQGDHGASSLQPQSDPISTGPYSKRLSSFVILSRSIAFVRSSSHVCFR